MTFLTQNESLMIFADRTQLWFIYIQLPQFSTRLNQKELKKLN